MCSSPLSDLDVEVSLSIPILKVASTSRPDRGRRTQFAGNILAQIFWGHTRTVCHNDLQNQRRFSKVVGQIRVDAATMVGQIRVHAAKWLATFVRMLK
jgi:hypothetical protein